MTIVIELIIVTFGVFVGPSRLMFITWIIVDNPTQQWLFWLHGGGSLTFQTAGGSLPRTRKVGA